LSEPVRFGLSGSGGGLEGDSDTPFLDRVEVADKLGFDCLWFNEEHFSAEWSARSRLHLSPIVTAMAAAARTRHIRVGFSVLLVPLHHPLRLAEDLATLDVLSGGRLNLGVSRGRGSSGSSQYARAFGYDLDTGATLEQCLDKILGYWAGNPVETDEQRRFVAPRPVQQPHPPVFVGAYHDESIVWAAMSGYALMQHGIQAPASMRRCLAVYSRAGGDVGRAPVGRFCYVGESDDVARREAWPTVVAQAERLRRIGLHHRGDLITTEADLEPERFSRETAIVGGPESVAERIGELRDELGVRYVNLLPSFFGQLPQDMLRRSLELFASEVMPRFN
jgi:alkanesulfonate monooxygenase SsuD/methylene tetrahydromethanopterin reductase-like flavin-dependent oxidoreductase (luciferase family)